MVPVKIAAKAATAAYGAKKRKEKKEKKAEKKEIKKQEKEMKDYRKEQEAAQKKEAEQKQDQQKKMQSKAAIRGAEMARNNPYRRFQNEHDEKKTPVEKRKSSFEMTMQEEVNSMQQAADQKGMNAAQKVQENALDK